MGLVAKSGFLQLQLLLTRFRTWVARGRALSAWARLQELTIELPPDTIAEASDREMVKITGVVAIAKDALNAPFSGERCVGYVASCDAHGFNRQERWCDFLVEDRTGRALVRVGPHVTLKQPRPPVRRERRAEQIKAFLGVSGQQGEFDLDAWSPREWTLAPGEAVAVVGVARWERDPEHDGGGVSSYRATPRLLVVEAPLESSLVVIDQPESRVRDT